MVMSGQSRNKNTLFVINDVNEAFANGRYR